MINYEMQVNVCQCTCLLLKDEKLKFGFGADMAHWLEQIHANPAIKHPIKVLHFKNL